MHTDKATNIIKAIYGGSIMCSLLGGLLFHSDICLFFTVIAPFVWLVIRIVLEGMDAAADLLAENKNKK